MTKKKQKVKPNHKTKIEIHIKPKNKPTESQATKIKQEFPTEFPFWARLKFEKHRTTLVIDEAPAFNKQKKKFEDGFVDREATSKNPRGNYEEIKPNPDKDKEKQGIPMFLRRPTKKPKQLFEPHNKNMPIPKELKERYSKNNKK